MTPTPSKSASERAALVREAREYADSQRSWSNGWRANQESPLLAGEEPTR